MKGISTLTLFCVEDTSTLKIFYTEDIFVDADDLFTSKTLLYWNNAFLRPRHFYVETLFTSKIFLRPISIYVEVLSNSKLFYTYVACSSFYVDIVHAKALFTSKTFLQWASFFVREDISTYVKALFTSKHFLRQYYFFTLKFFLHRRHHMFPVLRESLFSSPMTVLRTSKRFQVRNFFLRRSSFYVDIFTLKFFLLREPLFSSLMTVQVHVRPSSFKFRIFYYITATLSILSNILTYKHLFTSKIFLLVKLLLRQGQFYVEDLLYHWKIFYVCNFCTSKIFPRWDASVTLPISTLQLFNHYSDDRLDNETILNQFQFCSYPFFKSMYIFIFHLYIHIYTSYHISFIHFHLNIHPTYSLIYFTHVSVSKY